MISSPAPNFNSFSLCWLHYFLKSPPFLTSPGLPTQLYKQLNVWEKKGKPECLCYCKGEYSKIYQKPKQKRENSSVKIVLMGVF